jgi:hypothetical protein
MRNQDRSVGYFILLLLALAAGAVRLDADVPAQAPAVEPAARASLACSPADAAAQAAFCSASPALAWTDS